MAVYIGVDFHARVQTVSYLTTEDGAIEQVELHHLRDDVRGFYQQFTGEVIARAIFKVRSCTRLSSSEQQAQQDAQVRRLMTHPGLGPLTALCLVHTLAPINRFSNGRRVTGYAGLDPMEDSSGELIERPAFLPKEKGPSKPHAAFVPA